MTYGKESIGNCFKQLKVIIKCTFQSKLRIILDIFMTKYRSWQKQVYSYEDAHNYKGIVYSCIITYQLLYYFSHKNYKLTFTHSCMYTSLLVIFTKKIQPTHNKRDSEIKQKYIKIIIKYSLETYHIGNQHCSIMVLY